MLTSCVQMSMNTAKPNYTPVLTPPHTQAIFKYVDSSDGLTHKQSQSGREALPLEN